MTLPSFRDWLFSIKTFGAAMLAVYIGMAMALPRPYWAMATVYICSQPLSGATRSKAMFRVIGTFIGAAAAVALIPALDNAPVLLVGALSLWVAICLYFSLLDRTPRSYTFMLAGYTAALIGFPTVLAPETIFDTAVARVEEISVGIICASLVSGLFWPNSVGAVVAARAEAWIRNAARLSIDALSGRGGTEATRKELIRLAGDSAEIDMLATHLAYDTSNLRDTRRHIQALRWRMLALLPILSSIIDRMEALGAESTSLPRPIDPVVSRLRGWLNPGPLPMAAVDQAHEIEEADALRDSIQAAQPRLGAQAAWMDILSSSLLLRLRELVDIATDSRMLRRAIALNRPSLPRALAFDPEGGDVRIERHRDHAMALLSSFGVAIAIMLCCLIWIETGWPDGSAAPMMAAVACCFFASRDDPVPGILEFANWTAVAVAIMAVYQFAVMPMVHDFEVLALVLAPTFLVIGVLIARPATMGMGLALAANGATIMALQSTFTQDFASYVNSNMSLLLGMYVAAIVTRLIRSVGAEWAIWRLFGANRRTTAAAAEGHGRRDRHQLAALMMDRIGLMAPRLASIEAGQQIATVDLMAGLRIGLNILDIRRGREVLPEDARRPVDALLAALARRNRRRYVPPPPELLTAIDAALAATVPLDDSTAKRDILLGLVGIRRGLYPKASPYRAQSPNDPVPEERVAA